MAIIKFENFSFRFKNLKLPTLKNINLQINKGEKVLIAGPSGSGKSTLMHCINGIVPFAYSGSITGKLLVDGIEPYNENIFEISKRAGTILQDQDSQFIGLTVAEDVAFILENNNKPNAEIKKTVSVSLETVKMEEYLDHSPHELSGGQKQCTSLAGILSSDTNILLFDEPLANLDPASAAKIIKLIDELQKKFNKTIIIIEHRIEDVITCNPDKIVIINQGEIKACNTPDKLLKSNLLRKNGLREPLYIEALNFFNFNLNEIENIHNLESFSNQKIVKQITKCFDDKEKSNINNSESEPSLQLSIKNINFAYNKTEKQIIKDVSFDLNKGEIISILGNNGAGKSTLSQIMTGILKPDSGQIILNNEEIQNTSIKEIGRKIGYVMQNPNHMIVKHMIRDEVLLGLNSITTDQNFIENKYIETIKICGLYGYRNWPISSLSYGQKKRVTIASILAIDPEIIILDEPTAGQDYKTYTTFMDFIREIAYSGISIILITHDMHLALEYTSRSIVLCNGEIIGDDIPSKILSNRNIVEKANLKETSLGELANILQIKNKNEFTQKFIEREKQERKLG